jgi:DNA-binding MarR family transcriptional regulator
VSAPDGPPLARLFAIASRSLIDGLHERLRERGWDDVRPAYGFVLLAARDGTTATELATLMGVTKQAASKIVDAMEGARYVTRGPGVRDARQRRVELSERGVELLAAVESIYAELEDSWVTVIGRDHLERLRADLVAVLARADGALPAVRPTL